MTRTTSQLRGLWSPPCKGPWARVPLHGGAVVTVRPSIVEALEALDSCLEAADYEATPPDCGAYNCRPITGGSNYSLHAYGIAVDINWQANPYGKKLVTDMPAKMIQAIEAIRTNSGAQVFRWGGRYGGNKDAMHFEVVASPAELASGIRSSTKPAPDYTFVQAMLNIVRIKARKTPIKVDGILGDQTKAAIAEFQRDWNALGLPALEVTGSPDAETCAAVGDMVNLIMAAK